MNIEISLKDGYAGAVESGKMDSKAVRELHDCVRRINGTLASKGLKSAQNEFIVVGADGTQAASAVAQLLSCEAVAGAYIKPATELPAF